MKPDWRAGPRRVQHTPPGALFTCLNRIPDAAKAVLADPEQMAAIYATGSIERVARELGCSTDAVSRALRYHNIPVRPPGAPLGWRPPRAITTRGTRDVVRLAAWRAYRRLDRCPLDCPHERGCTWDDDCRLDQEIKGREEDALNH